MKLYIFEVKTHDWYLDSVLSSGVVLLMAASKEKAWEEVAKSGPVGKTTVGKAKRTFYKFIAARSVRTNRRSKMLCVF